MDNSHIHLREPSRDAQYPRMSHRPSPKPPSFSAVRQGNFGIPAAARKWNQDSRPATTHHVPSSPKPPELAHRHRNRSMWAQALVLFNVIGIPLSHTTYLEYHFTTLFPSTSLVSLALVLSLQLLCIFATSLPIGYVYSTFGNRVTWLWKAIFAFSIIIATASQFALYKARSYIAVLLLQGPVLGIALGTCFTISTLVLATHYRNDVPLVSVQSGFAGFAGAVVYTVVARFSFQRATTTTTTSSGALAHVYNGGVMGATLLAAFFLLVRLRLDGEKSWTERYKLHLCMPKGFLQDVRGGGMWFILGYMLVFMGMLVYPVYVVIFLTQPPGHFFPDTAAYAILAMLGVAAMSGSVAANVRALRKVGPVNTFAAASVLAGAICLAPVSYPRLYVVVPLAALYGLALGALLSLHMIVAATFLSKKVQGGWDDDMPARVAIIMALAGLSALGSVAGAAALIEGSEKGNQIVMKVAGACMLGGGVLIACARVWRWRGVFYAV